MVQVLPYVPNFGEQLAPILAQAGQNIGQGLLQRRANMNDQNILSQFTANPNSSPMEMIQAFGKLSPQAQQSISPLFQHLVSSTTSKLAKQEEKQASEQQEHEDISSTVNKLIDELETGKIGKFNQFNKLTSKGREHRAYFDELALGVEKRLATMVGKGVLSQARFNYLLKNLPKSSDTDATNRGRLRALAEEFKVIRKEEKASPQNKPALSDIFK